MARPNKKQPLNKYQPVDPEYGTAEQRLASAIAQEGGVDALLSLMNYMQPKSGSSIYDTPSSGARAYMVDDSIFVQRPGESGGYTDRGFKISSGNIGAVPGLGGEVSPSERKIINSMLQNQDVIRYFMDIYGSEAKGYPKVRRYNSKPPNDPERLDIQKRRKVHDSCKGSLNCYQ